MTTSAHSEGQAGPRVKTRRVHFLAGFDPRGARHYHRLYREEAAKQERLTGAGYEVGDRRRVSGKISGWKVTGVTQGESVTTDFQFMGWDDIVRGDWDNSRWKLLWRGLRYYVRYSLAGGFTRMGKTSKGAYYTSLLPLFYLLTLAEVMITLAAIALWLVHAANGSIWLGALLAAVTFALTGHGGIRLDERLGTLWILRSCVFTYDWSLKSPPEIEARAVEMAAHILKEQQANPVDEVVIIGHSSGAFVLVPVAARLIEKANGQLPPQVKLLTVGSCIPYLSITPTATTFHHDLAVVAGAPIHWTMRALVRTSCAFTRSIPFARREFPRRFLSTPGSFPCA